MGKAQDLVRELVSAFGDPEAIVELLADTAEWWISPSVGVLGSPTVGRDDIHESMQIIFTTMYGDVRTEIHHVLANRTMAACRFTLRADALFADGRPYENEYSVWIEVEDGLIIRVWEYLDVAHVMKQLGLTDAA